MKNSRGNGLITAVIAIIIILIIALIGMFIYNYVFLDSEQTINNNTEHTNEINNIIQDTNNILNNEQVDVIEPIIDPNQNVINNDEQSLISNNYYYNQLNSYGKIIYDKLKQEKSNLINGNHVFDFKTQFNVLLHEENGKEELGQAFQSAWNAFSYDNTDLFYIDVSKMNLITEERSIGGIKTYYVSIAPQENGNYLKDSFQTKDKILEAQEYIDNIITQIKQQTIQDSDAEKARKVQNWLISIIEYDDTDLAINKHNIYGALRERRAVCEGYARTFKYIMEKIGVPCILVSGKGTNSQGEIESHAWNYVQIQNELKWYAVDVTWNDPIIIGTSSLTDEMKYKYFLIGSEEFFKNHTEDGLISENSMKFTFPTLSTTNYQR